jgi:hypothetical protein
VTPRGASAKGRNVAREVASWTQVARLCDFQKKNRKTRGTITQKFYGYFRREKAHDFVKSIPSPLSNRAKFRGLH